VKKVVEILVKGLVDQPERVAVKQVEGEKSVVIEVRVPSEELGRVIGKNGRVINSLRAVGKAAGVRHQKSVWVDVAALEEEAPTQEPG
jgi:hypothetical protein